MVTDEHFVPVQGLELQPYLDAGDVTAVHHLIRYQWAIACIAELGAQRARGILDVACGAGYGSFEVGRRFPDVQVTGADYDERAIDLARKTYSLPNLEFRHADVTRWGETLGDHCYGCVVSFDTIEHVMHREIMMENLVRHLHPDGVLLLSTPCGSDVNELRPGWEHHRIEYSAASLYDFVRRYFETVLRPDAGALPHVEVFERLRGSGIDYLLRMNPVLCRDPLRIANPYRSTNDCVRSPTAA